MFGVIEGSGGAGDKPAACCTNQKKKKASRWRPYGDLMEDRRGVCAVSSPQRRRVMIRGGGDVTLPAEKYCHHLRVKKMKCCSGILLP